MTLQPGSGSYRARVDRWQTETGADLETRRPISETHSGGRSPCGVEARATNRRSIRGSHGFSNANRSRSWRWRLPTRWRAPPGRRWPGGRQLSSACACGSGVRSCRQQSKFASVRIWTAGVMTTLMRNGRDRRSGKPVMGHAILERALLVGTRSADHIRASGHSGCIATEASLHAKTDPMKVARAG